MFGISIKWLFAAAAIAAFATMTVVILNGFEKLGGIKEREAVIKQNKDAGNAGENARLNLHECLSRGLRFDYATGKCQS